MAGRRNRVKVTDRRAGKAWLKRKQPRPVTAVTIAARKTFLIICEGQTEVDYFSAFHGAGVVVRAESLGCTQAELIECTLQFKDGKEYDEVWAVFDVDFNPQEGTAQYQKLRDALTLAESHGIGVAYSNDAFELWFRLHYEPVTGHLTRKQLYEDLSKRWNVNYAQEGKKRGFREGIKALLDNDEAASQQLAIQRAKKLWEERSTLPHPEQNPITSVHLLFERLLGAKWE